METYDVISRKVPHHVSFRIPYHNGMSSQNKSQQRHCIFEVADTMPYITKRDVKLSKGQFMMFSQLFIWPSKDPEKERNPYFREWARDDTMGEPKPLYLITKLLYKDISYDDLLRNPFYFMFNGKPVHQKVFIWAYSDIVQCRFQSPGNAESISDLDRMSASFLKMTKQEIELGKHMRSLITTESLPLSDNVFPSFYVRYDSYTKANGGQHVIKVKDNDDEDRSYTIILASQIPFNLESVSANKPYIHIKRYVINTHPGKSLILVATQVDWICSGVAAPLAAMMTHI